MGKNVFEVEIKGHRLVCPICGHAKFSKRTARLLKSAWFIGKTHTTNYICAQCGYIYSFSFDDV